MGTPQDLVAIEILTSIAGPGMSWRPGQIVELPPQEARRWCDGQRARYVNPPPAEPVPAPPVVGPAPAADPGQQPAAPVGAPPPANAAQAKPVKKAAKAAKATARKR